MCGRFSLIESVHELQQQFEFDLSADLQPRFNIAPSQEVFSIISDGKKRRGGMLRWGLVPHWAKEAKIGYKMINARAEGIDEKPSFREPFRKKRCLIIADGFYEWKKVDDRKQPYRFVMKDGKPFAFAGLWETWKKGDAPLHTCTIITTTPNALTEDVHDRMPVILKRTDYARWLDPSNQAVDELKSLLVPYPAEEMELYAVSELVNSPKNDVADVLSPLNSL
ncbi:SOS response-associated peptidase [Rossellomorea marisflavi]|uniref:SOS response-associated peptidase n=1 Tax=Rossellomorea marisflavi TaxID=189381 RepID=UPI00203D4BFD|nr:SOS response-associated peptidase [Rossellomorea marisflavi]MCM2605433.1 SOS response-associated peptidase [Rossellomorea marisflavi]